MASQPIILSSVEPKKKKNWEKRTETIFKQQNAFAYTMYMNRESILN